MLSIIKLRLMNLKNEYFIIVIMTFMALLLTFVMGAAFNGDFRSNIVIVDQDNSEYSKILVDEITKNNSFKFEVSNYENAFNKVDSEKALSAVVIKKGFGKNIEEQSSPSISFIKVKDDMEIYTIQNIVYSITNNMIGNIKMAENTVNYISSINNDVDKENLSCHKTVFISVCDIENRAIVVKACEKDWDQSFSKASEKLEKRLKKKNINPKWLKLDWVVSENKMSYKEFIEAINLYKANYFRYGITFDDNYTFAFLEQ